jgi:hypothetical protein
MQEAERRHREGDAGKDDLQDQEQREDPSPA